MAKLKRYRLKINPKKGAIVDFISQVENPAIERGFLKFKDEVVTQYNEDKMEIFGPVLIPDMPIYRRSEQLGEYEIVFKEEDIKEIQMEFMKNGFNHNMNLDHSKKMAESFVFESFVSSELVPNPEPFKDLPLGTWFIRAKVEDKKVWEDIKSGKRTGFSIEGTFQYLVEEFEKHFLQSNTTNLIEDQEKIILEVMIKDLFKRVFAELSKELDEKEVIKEEVKAESQKVSSSDYKIESREVGAKVEIIDADGTLVSAPDGEYEFEDGFKFIVKDGVIESIEGEVEAPEVEVEAKEKVDEKEEEKMEEPDYQGQIDSLKKEIEDLKSMIMGVPSKEDMSKEFGLIKEEFKSIFEKFSKVPAQESKVNKSNILKDEQKKKFEEFLTIISKK